MRRVTCDRLRWRVRASRSVKLMAGAYLVLMFRGAAFAEFPLDPLCQTVRNVPYPVADQASAEEAGELARCNSGDLFF
jgi:hypothetical protein